MNIQMTTPPLNLAIANYNAAFNGVIQLPLPTDAAYVPTLTMLARIARSRGRTDLAEAFEQHLATVGESQLRRAA